LGEEIREIDEVQRRIPRTGGAGPQCQGGAKGMMDSDVGCGPRNCQC
jgi:hypothetical protein